MPMVDRDIERELMRVLGEGEELLWTGRPKKGLVLRRSDAIMIPFSLVWCGFAIFWVMISMTMGAPMLFTMFGIPFVLIGLYLVVGRFFADARKRAITIYALTRERVIIRDGLLNTTLKSISIKSLTDITLEQRPDGSGTILLRDDITYARYNAYSDIGSSRRTYVSQGPRLEMIDDVQSVYNQLLALQKHA